MSAGRKRKYATPEEARAAQKAQQAAFRLARKNGTWVPKYKKCVDKASQKKQMRQSEKENAKILRKAAVIVAKAEVKERREQERVLRKAERVAVDLAERAARAAQEAAERRDVELAEAELERQRAAAERRETARRARMSSAERERADALAAAAHEREVCLAREKYGFDLDGEAKTAKELAGKARYERDQARLAEAAFAKKREKLILKIRAKRLAVEARERAREAALSAGREVAEALLQERDIGYEVSGNSGSREAGRAASPLAAASQMSQSSQMSRSHAPGAKPRGSTLKRHEALLAEYGFEVWRNEPADPNSEAELAARKRYLRAQEAEYRAKHHAQITAYNREYRRRKRAEALVAAQKTWTAAEWAAYQKREASKELGPGTPAWLVREVVRLLAAQENLSEEIVTQQLIERDAIDFITQGALALGSEKARRPAMVAAALRATCLYLDPDRAVLCGDGAGKKGSGNRDRVSGNRDQRG